MHLLTISGSLLSLSAALQCVSAKPAHQPRGLRLRQSSNSSILINPAPQPPLPSVQSASAAALTVGLNLTNIQGDILVGMKKNIETFYFFTINDVTTFQQQLGINIYPLITNTKQLLNVSAQPVTAVNLAFSQQGLNTLGVTGSLGDSFFSAGQLADASFLGDPGTTNWVSAFTNPSTIHGVFLLASNTVDNVNDELQEIQNILGDSISEVYSLQANVRPGAEEGHEHFGFMDGISQPAVNGFSTITTRLPGQIALDPGLFLLNQTGDTIARPSWSKEGSFLAFRQLKQMVPEFDAFCTANALNISGLTPQQNADLLGARLIGRWKSGAPVDLAPRFDNPTLANNPFENNNFNFTHPGESITTDQEECPFAAHVRKTRPRADFNPENTPNHIIRAGIPYGPEVTDAEESAGVSSTDPTQERGLAFVAYQAQLGNGFRFLQHTWANNKNFIFGKNDTTPGFDPIIGANAGQARFVSGTDPNNQANDLDLPIDFVVSRGGEYFFSPPLAAIAGILSGNA